MASQIITLDTPLPVAEPAGVEDDLGGERADRLLGWIVVGLFFGVFALFAAVARLDAAAYAEGTISVSGSRQAVQHRDGGVVAALHVREGQHVQAGDILIELAGAEVAANERALAAQAIGLQAERARLLAERAGAAIAAPPEFATLSADDRRLADEAMRLQAGLLASRRGALSSQKKVLAQQAAQLSQRIAGLGQQMVENDRQRQLFDAQLQGMNVLVEKGYASINRMRELERARANVASDRAGLSSSSAAAREQIGETRMQALTLDARALQDVADALRANEQALGEIVPKWLAAQRQVAQTRIRAPATGQVVGLKVFTVGGVVAPGDKLMEIVPDAASLVVQAMFSPNDADDIFVGQKAEVRFVTMHERDLPVFEGKVTRLSADSFADERSGLRYYTGEVTVPAADLDRLRTLKGKADAIKPGLPVQVLVPLKKRTLLQYLIEPLNQVLWRSGHEH